VPAIAALLFGTALFVAVFGPQGGSTGARSAITRPAVVKIVSSEGPTDLQVDASSAATPTATPSEPSSASVAAPASVEPPAAVPAAILWPAVSQSTESDPVSTASMPPDAAAPFATRASKAVPLNAPQRPAEAAPKAERKVVVDAPQRPNLDRTGKLFSRPPVSATVAKTAPTAPAETPRQPERSGASTILRAPAEAHAIAPAAAQEPVNPTTHVFGARTGVLGASAVDQTAAKSGDWAIQFAAPKSEAEAAVAAGRLNAEYAPALNGATVGVRKIQMNGETIYAVRVAGLSKADATALCVRVKGRDCSTIK
jgi:hypothetical protein